MYLFWKILPEMQENNRKENMQMQCNIKKTQTLTNKNSNKKNHNKELIDCVLIMKNERTKQKK